MFGLAFSSMPDAKKNTCCHHGPGYASPEDAFRNGPREKYLFVACPSPDKSKPDRVVTVDVDPTSPTYCEVISKVVFPNLDDEVHHTGWNACSSCYNDENAERRFLVVPCLNSSRVYFIDTTYPSNLKLHKVLEPKALFEKNVSFPHTTHCLQDGNIMISTLGDRNYDPKGSFVLIDGKSLEVVDTWPAKDNKDPKFGYDFWYQPRINAMISTEWGDPKRIKKGLSAKDFLCIDDVYGREIHVWDWKERKIIQNIKLESSTGLLPFEIRFLHKPDSVHGYFCTAFGSAIYHFHRPEGMKEFIVNKIDSIQAQPLKSWLLPDMPGLMSDILISMDDKYLYVSCWLRGAVRQYDITVPEEPKLVGEVFFGGLERAELKDDEIIPKGQKRVRMLKGKKIHGGPQMLQLSLDGERLYVTTSLYSIWDKQIYPELTEHGSVIVQINCNTENGGLTLNEDFLVDFETVEDGPFLAHEMRYPGGDCTSDIWI